MFGVSRARYWLQEIEKVRTHRNFRSQLKDFRKLCEADGRMPVDDRDLLPCLNDATTETAFDTHYIYHPAWAARVVRSINPFRHTDISSTLHFCSMLSTFIPVDFYDYRPARLTLPGLDCGAADLTNLFFDTGSIDSLSCMHTIEHVGLGRYGDPLDPVGDVKAIKELQRVTRPGGNLLIVTPVGKPRIQFNAHRIYSFELINDLFGDFELKDFSLVTDAGEFLSDADPSVVRHQTYGCGCFWYKKKDRN
jgi:SAM-dependent methyltransferase